MATTTDFKIIFNHVFYGGLLLLAIGLPVSIFLVSLSQFILIGSWLLSGDIKNKIKISFGNKAVLILISVYLLHVIGLLHTHDIDYAIKDLRIKLPLLLLPLMFASMPVLHAGRFKLLLSLFVLSALISSGISTAIYFGFTHKQITDIRQISPFMSHIRLSMYMCIAIYVCVWFYYKSKITWQRITALILLCWFLYFLLILESVTAFGILFITGFFIGLFYVIHLRNKLLLFGFVVVLALVSFSGYRYIHHIWKEVTTISNTTNNRIRAATVNGNAYTHNVSDKNTENGYLVNINICESELKDTWNKRSQLSYDGKNLRGDDLRFTIIRFLTSKGLTKDAEAVQQLSAIEIAAIEKGVANVDYMNTKSLRPRIKVTLWELTQYRLFRNPDGHSIAMRLEFWRTAWLIIKQNVWIGVGTGDVPGAFAKMYAETNSPLSESYRFRAHNQYITMAVALGIPFLVWFIITLIAPAFIQKRNDDYLYLAFLITVLISFFTEDTLETQAGLSFYACFNCLFLFLRFGQEEAVYKTNSQSIHR